MGQQLSTKAARTIYGRLAGLFGDRAPTPEELLEVDAEVLRGVGLSRNKASYLRSLAEHVISGELELDRLSELPDEEVIAQLTAVKGLGPWTAHMFLIFHLGRPDVLPVGDLGCAGRRSWPTGWRSCRPSPSSRRSPSRGGRTAHSHPCTCGARWTTSRGEPR